ncbi:hypothetical protein BC832DRAFT_427182 [Gaertneriomyces semiglobifer]|nr:hypothetical protein BC832DRAFT_427182 [Gaertneriomyces semiglobifer]
MSHHYSSPVPAHVRSNPAALKYRRRILSPRSLQPPAARNYLMLGAHCLTAGTLAYMILWSEWGEDNMGGIGDREHVFKPIRRAFWGAWDRWWGELSDNDIKELKSKGHDLSTVATNATSSITGATRLDAASGSTSPS